jgi:hypothetical protein
MTTIAAYCPDRGRWRTWLDGEAGAETAVLETHLAGCAACAGEVAALRDNAAFVGAALAKLAPAAPGLAGVNPAVGDPTLPGRGERRSAESDSQAAVSVPAGRGWPLRWRVSVAGLAAALALTIVVGTEPGRTAAAQFLAQFRSQRFAAVTFDRSQARNPLAALEGLGTVQGNRRAAVYQPAQSLWAASQRVGFDVKQPDPAMLPEGLSRQPTISVWPASELRFTFDREKAARYFASIGRTDVVLPPRFHGASLVVAVPPGVLLEYVGAPGGRSLLVGQARELEVGVEGEVSLAELREFLLGLPGLPPATAQQLRAIQDWRTTLPIPVPVEQLAWQPVTVDGVQGLLLADHAGLGSGMLWQRDGRVYGVAGALPAAEIQRVAHSLR